MKKLELAAEKMVRWEAVSERVKSFAKAQRKITAELESKA